MSPKDIIAFGIILFIVAYYLKFHFFWQVFFACMILAGCVGVLIQGRRARKKRELFASIHPFDSKKKRSRRR